MSTPGNKFDDSGWASNSNSVNSFCSDSTLCGTDEADFLLDVDTAQHSSPSFEGANLTEPLLMLSTSNPISELSTVSSEPDVSVLSVSVDADESADSLHEWSMADLPSSWQAITSNLELDCNLLPLVFDHIDDADVTAVDVNDMIGNGSHAVNGGLDYFPEVNELLAFVGE